MRAWGQIPSIHVKACQLCVTVIPVLLQDGRHPGESLQAHRPTILVQAKVNNERPHLKHRGRQGLPIEAVCWLSYQQYKCMPVHTIMNVCIPKCLMVRSHNIALLPSDVLPMLWVYRIFCIIFFKVIPNAGSNWHLNKYVCVHTHTYKSPCMYDILKRKFKYKITT